MNFVILVGVVVCCAMHVESHFYYISNLQGSLKLARRPNVFRASALGLDTIYPLCYIKPYVSY